MRRLSTGVDRFRVAVAAGLFALLAACGDDPATLVVDDAQLLTPEQEEKLVEYHRYLRTDHDIDYRVVTGRDVGDINRYAVQMFSRLGVGGHSSRARGFLLVVDAGNDLVRLEVSRSLEGVFPDAFIAYIQYRQMIPYFREDRVADGILATTELIIDQAQKAKAKSAMDDPGGSPGSAGAGATAAARLGVGRDESFRRGPAGGGPGETPGETLDRYFAAMQARNANPSLPIYSQATRRMLATWVVTPAQMDNVLKTYRTCRPEPARVDETGRRAVIRYPVDARRCAPWFFEKAEDGWVLDLTAMQHHVRFGRSNAWHFAETSGPTDYAFAFADWRLDSNGYPHERK